MTIDRNTKVCTIDDVMETFKLTTGRSRSRATKAANFLEEEKIFPLTYGNPKLAPLNVLGLLVYLTGNLRNTEQSYRAAISCKGNHARSVFPSLEDALNISLPPVENDSHIIGRNGSLYGRLLFATGYPVSSGTSAERETKAKIGTKLPPYLANIISGWNDLTMENREVCAKYIRDFLSTLMDARSGYNKRSFRVSTLCQPNETLVEEQLGQIKQTFKCLYGNIIDPDSWACSVVSSCRPLAGKITIPSEDVYKLATKTHLPIKVEICQTAPKYSFT